MSNYSIYLTKDALKDHDGIKKNGSWNLKWRVDRLLSILRKDPFVGGAGFRKLLGEFEGLYCRRLDAERLLIYQVMEDEKVVKIISMA